MIHHYKFLIIQFWIVRVKFHFVTTLLTEEDVVCVSMKIIFKKLAKMLDLYFFVCYLRCHILHISYIFVTLSGFFSRGGTEINIFLIYISGYNFVILRKSASNTLNLRPRLPAVSTTAPGSANTTPQRTKLAELHEQYIFSSKTSSDITAEKILETKSCNFANTKQPGEQLNELDWSSENITF